MGEPCGQTAFNQVKASQAIDFSLISGAQRPRRNHKSEGNLFRLLNRECWPVEGVGRLEELTSRWWSRPGACGWTERPV